MILKKYPYIHQKESKDCGVCCLSMIIKYYNGCVSEDTLYDMTKTTKNGTSAYNLINAAKTFGFKAGGVRCEVDKLNYSNPFIAHVLIDKKYGHYIVVYKINKKKKELYIGDPAIKRMKMSFEKFKEIFTGVVITLTPEKKLPIYENQISLKNYIKDIICSNKKEWILLYIKSLLLIIVSLIFSLSLVIMLNAIKISSQNWVYKILIIFLVIGLVKNIISYTKNKMLYQIQQKIDNKIIFQSIKNIILLPYKFYCNRSTGDITKRIRDLENVSYKISELMSLIFIDSLMAVISAFLLCKISFNLFKLSFIWIILYLLISLLFKNPLKNKIEKLKQKSSNLFNNLIESIKGFETIKNLQLENKNISKLTKEYIEYNKELYNFKNTNEKQIFMKNIVSDIGYLLLYAAGCIQISNGTLTLTELIAFQTMFVYLLLPVEHLIEMNVSFYDMEKSLQRGLEILYFEKNNQKLKCNKISSIEIKNLKYESILNDISIKFKRGEKILLMGKSGSGKSTLLKLIRGYYQVSNGNIYINNIEYNFYDKNNIGNKITYISQNEIIFTNTLYNNIKLDRNIKDKEISKQIKINYIDDIIKEKTIGLGEIIEENGNNLSGGERQRIILARSLLKSSDVILIDEGFSQMDSNLERKILKNIFKYYSDKIILVVSHRKDNLDLYDTYIEMQKGRIKKYLQKSC